MFRLIAAYPLTIATAVVVLSAYLAVLWSSDPAGDSAPLTVAASLVIAATGNALLNRAARRETARQVARRIAARVRRAAGPITPLPPAG